MDRFFDQNFQMHKARALSFLQLLAALAVGSDACMPFLFPRVCFCPAKPDHVREQMDDGDDKSDTSKRGNGSELESDFVDGWPNCTPRPTS
jgi:hypothetical protein